MTQPTRRAVIAAGTSLIVAGAVTGVAIGRDVPMTDLFRRVLERYLGHLNMPDDDLDQFANAFSERRGWQVPHGKLASGYEAAHIVGLPEMSRRILPAEYNRRLEAFDRHLLGDFYLYTTIGYREDPQEEVYYLGPTPCQNPFAEFAA
ncbi:hypothetical protein [Wenxinia marina]|uniref:Uncharacterized protein n=1 Tax=Wenxinia marina DSM 24838 TaxID=1123501 RepID=A0A0D0QE39_9RHOB|nr:hypothetical protein [Wenxinia marina]KIQ69278.1 hypothetical protein Wenmar_02349 [Wenxinia marina DSM 24838]GGL71768.1 hypothetical protein GCM10011392_27960 [Wenxinia marina]